MKRKTTTKRKPLIDPEKFHALTEDDLRESRERDAEWARQFDTPVLRFKKSRTRKAPKKATARPAKGRTPY
jgi:hypothetical protein